MVDLNRPNLYSSPWVLVDAIGNDLEALIDARVHYHLNRQRLINPAIDPITALIDKHDRAATAFIEAIDALIQDRLEYYGALPTTTAADVKVDNLSSKYKTTIEDVPEPEIGDGDGDGESDLSVLLDNARTMPPLSGYTKFPSYDKDEAILEAGFMPDAPPKSTVHHNEVSTKQPMSSLDRLMQTVIEAENKKVAGNKANTNPPPKINVSDKQVLTEPEQPYTSMDRINEMLLESSKRMDQLKEADEARAQAKLLDPKPAVNRSTSTFGCKAASEETTAGDIGQGVNNVTRGYDVFGNPKPNGMFRPGGLTKPNTIPSFGASSNPVAASNSANPTTGSNNLGEGINNVNRNGLGGFGSIRSDATSILSEPSIPVPTLPGASANNLGQDVNNANTPTFGSFGRAHPTTNSNGIPPGGLFGSGRIREIDIQSLFASAVNNQQSYGTNNQTSGSFGNRAPRTDNFGTSDTVPVYTPFGRPSNETVYGGGYAPSDIYFPSFWYGNASTRSGLFGSNPAPAQANSTGLFGCADLTSVHLPTGNQSSGLYGSGSARVNNTGSVFGNPVAPTNSTGLFGASNPTLSQNNTGNQTSGSSGLFGAGASSNYNGSLFGPSPTLGRPANQTNSNGVFGSSNVAPAQTTTGNSTNRTNLFPQGEWRPPILNRIETTLNRVESQVSAVDAMQENLRRICEHIGMPVPEGLEDVSE